MPNRSSAYDKERLNHINFLMDTIADSSNIIYECLVDREFEPLKKEIPNLISLLTEIQNSVEDEI
jgi:hypothetical protein